MITSAGAVAGIVVGLGLAIALTLPSPANEAKAATLDSARPVAARAGEPVREVGATAMAGSAAGLDVLAMPVTLALEPSGDTAPRRCGPFDPAAFRPAPGPGRQRCGEPHPERREAPEPQTTRCGSEAAHH